MDELKAELAIILRAGSDRDNFTELDDLWQPEDSKLFYRAVMSLVRFKFLLRCVRFDDWHIREQRKVRNKFVAVADIRDIFLIDLRLAYIPDDCISVDEHLVEYCGRIPGRTYISSKPRKYGLKCFGPVSPVLDMHSMAFHTVAKKVTKFIETWHRIL